MGLDQSCGCCWPCIPSGDVSGYITGIYNIFYDIDYTEMSNKELCTQKYNNIRVVCLLSLPIKVWSYVDCLLSLPIKVPPHIYISSFTVLDSGDVGTNQSKISGTPSYLYYVFHCSIFERCWHQSVSDMSLARESDIIFGSSVIHIEQERQSTRSIETFLVLILGPQMRLTQSANGLHESQIRKARSYVRSDRIIPKTTRVKPLIAYILTQSAFPNQRTDFF